MIGHISKVWVSLKDPASMRKLQELIEDDFQYHLRLPCAHTHAYATATTLYKTCIFAYKPSTDIPRTRAHMRAHKSNKTIEILDIKYAILFSFISQIKIEQ